jgi:hypothetical protein
MTIDGKEAERIAKDLIGEIASEWTDAPNARCVDEDGEHIFIYTLPPVRIVRDDLLVERPAAISTFHFNPLAEATEIVISIDSKLGIGIDNLGMRDYLTRRDAKHQIRQMLIAAPQIFGDAPWHARIIAEALYGIEVSLTFGKPDRAREHVNTTADMIAQKVREGFGQISKARNPKINQFSINLALKVFYRKYKETGEIPSQRQFAKQMDVTAKAWRDFLTEHNFDKHEVIVKEWFEELRAQKWGE